VTHFIGFQRDVTDRVERERDLEAARAQLEATFERIADGFFSLDDEYRFTHLNDRAAEYVPDGDVVGEVIWDVFPEARGTVFESTYREAMRTGEPRTFVGPYETETESRDLEVSVYPDEEGLSVFFRDVTERVRREAVFEALHDVTERMQHAATTGEVFDIAVDGARDVLALPLTACWRRDDEGLVPVAATDAAWEAGPQTYSPADPQWAVFEAAEATVFENGDELPGDITAGLYFPLGEYGLLGAAAPDTDTYRPYLLDAGRVLADHVTTALDRASREESLRDRERDLRQYETVLRTAGDPIYTLDTDAHFTGVNDAMTALTGYDRDRLVGTHISVILGEEDIARSERHIRDLARTDETTRTAEVDVETESGEVRRCEINIALLPSEDGAPRGTVGVLRDITDRERRRERLAVLDRVLRHNIRNKLNVVLGHAAGVQGRSDDPATLADLDAIVESAESLLAVAEKVRAFHNSGKSEVTPRDAVAVARSVAADCRERHPDATVVVRGQGPASVLADDGLELAVGELVESAIHHAGGESTITVVVEPAGREWVEVSVADDGGGIPGAELAAFAGTPETPLSHTTGVGLWLVSWAVARVGGTVSYDTGDDGTTVRFRLRRARGPDRTQDRG
jgi:PAS domain S-box-containing protein